MRKAPGLVILTFATAAVSFAQQGLVCPPPPSALSGKACEAFHYHVQLYRPDTKGLTEIAAIPAFATQAACDRAREERVRRNLAVVDFFKRVKEQQYEPDRVGPCHCDMTNEKTSPAYLQEAVRITQIRTAEDIRLRVREKLLDNGLTSDSELVRGLLVPAPTLPLLSAPKLVALPPPTPSTAVYTSDELEGTRAVEVAKPVVVSLDMPLVEISIEPPVADANAAPAPVAPTTEEIAAAPEAGVSAAAEEAADSFITYEIERIQNVLKAASAISDESVKSKIFQAVQQRNQLLSNLRALIEGAGVRSRLATAARAAQTEEERVAFAAKLFGDAITRAWAPKDAAEVIIEPAPDIDAEPERVLRDTGVRFTDQQKRRALYMLLARSQPTNEQQLWLITVADAFVR
jgi:hypothetical protein